MTNCVSQITTQSAPHINNKLWGHILPHLKFFTYAQGANIKKLLVLFVVLKKSLKNKQTYLVIFNEIEDFHIYTICI